VFAAGFPAYVKAPGSYASISVETLAKLLEANELLLVDSRPKKAKFDKGHIPSAISIPDADFENFKGKLPVDQNTLLVFYCGGYT
jgi:rhodanese-related sulfurtransferase